LPYGFTPTRVPSLLGRDAVTTSSRRRAARNVIRPATRAGPRPPRASEGVPLAHRCRKRRSRLSRLYVPSPPHAAARM
jgi:hypothetical protein